MPPVTPNAIKDTHPLQDSGGGPEGPPYANSILPSYSPRSGPLLRFFYLLDLVPHDLAVRDRGLLLARLAGQRAGEQLAGPLARNHDELEAIVLGWRLHETVSFLCPFERFQNSGRGAAHRLDARAFGEDDRPQAIDGGLDLVVHHDILVLLELVDLVAR